jgi:hypothetical protein
MRNLLFVLLLVAGLFVAVSASPVQAGEDKISVCHVPPGNPENAHVIWVGPAAVPAHLAHGDVAGVDPNSIEQVLHCTLRPV